ncbi:MAG: flagellar basal body P-ring protein FlgI [Ignavibacteria bacterium]|nr:flagellar basal body P-ring protein FlgI [Ignavibacteria bacterium]
MKKFFAVLFTIITLVNNIFAVRVKDIAYVNGVMSSQLIGYGLVTGLNGSGDTQRSAFTLQSVSSMLKRFGVTVSQDALRLRNVAAVMITATVPPFVKKGGTVDVIVSSMGDATSLQGGTLLLTPISAIDGVVYAMAQGPISVGGFSATAGGSEFRRSHTASGRIPSGAILDKEIPTNFHTQDWKVEVVLFQPDFTTAQRISDTVNTKFGSEIAFARDASSVTMNVPAEFQSESKVVQFIAQVESFEVSPDVAAKVVINERTGTVVAGSNVTILPAAISHGGITIEIQQVPVISQPGPFSKGNTVQTELSAISASQDTSSVKAISGAATVQDVAQALNSLRVKPRDIIAIFQALKEAGALKAELIII